MLTKHLIFRLLVAMLRGDRLVRNEDSGCNLISDIPRLAPSENFGRLDLDDLHRLGVCRVPNFILNALVCEKLAAMFGDLGQCECFVKIGEYWRLDIDDRLARTGLLLPIRSRSTGLIYALKIFRYPDDQRPFRLKTRAQD